MSEIVKAIKYFDTGERKIIDERFGTPLFQETVDIKSKFEDTHIYKAYKIEVKFGNSCFVDDTVDNGEIILEAVNRTKNQVIEAIFGEFRQDFRMLEKAIYEHDFNKAGKLLFDFEKKMFSTD